jgi:hypothetical protein
VPVGFRVADAEHSAAKDAANEAFVRALDRFGVLRGPDSLFFLDHWAEGPATSSSAGSVLPSCRTTAALLGAGVDPRRLFSATKDLGIVAWLRGRGVNAFHGDWRDALAAASRCSKDRLLLWNVLPNSLAHPRATQGTSPRALLATCEGRLHAAAFNQNVVS